MMQILSEQEEAYYGYLAVVNSTSIKENTIQQGSSIFGEEVTNNGAWPHIVKDMGGVIIERFQ